MGSRWYTVVIDSNDPARLARWWAEVLEYQIVYEGSTEVTIARDENTYPGLVFVPVPERKTGKNRLHLDLNPDDQDAEVERLVNMGARRVGAARHFEGGEIQQTIVDMEAGYLILMSVSDGSSIVVLASRNCDVGQIGYEMALLVDRVGKALAVGRRQAVSSGAER